MEKKLRYLPTALGLGGFLALTYVACSAWDGIFPGWAMHQTWAPLLPGFEWWSWGSFFLGLAESFVYGFWFALAVPIVNWSQRWLTSHEAAPREVAHSHLH